MRPAKELFQASPVFKSYAEILNNPAFETACVAALASFMEDLPRSAGEPSKAWDCYLQYLGAAAVLKRLSELHLNKEELKPDPKSWQYQKPEGGLK